MTRSVANWLHRYRWWPWVITLLFLPGLLWPAGWWFEVDTLHIADSKVGESVPIVVDRHINRNFDASWTVVIRQWDGGWTAHCVSTGAGSYKSDAKLPKNPTLAWWTWDKCHPLPAGKYEVITVWHLHTHWPVVGHKRVEVTSNVFQVTE